MRRKTTVWIFQAINCWDYTWEDLNMVKKWGKLKKETGSLLMAAQNNTKSSYYIKEKIDYMQQNSKYRLCGERDETVNHIINEINTLTLRNTRPGITRWKGWCIRNSARDRNVNRLENGLWTSPNPSYWMRRIKLSVIFWHANKAPNPGRKT